MNKEDQAWLILQDVRTGELTEIEALQKLESSGMCFKADDQRLPTYPSPIYADNNSLAIAIQQIRRETQQDMLTPKDGTVWVKVYTEE